MSTTNDLSPTEDNAAPVRTFSELNQMVAEGAISEKELAPYFILDESASYNLEPVFSLNSELVTVEPGEAAEESALFLNVANGWARRLRQKRYRDRIRESQRPGAPKPIKVVAEGDSWFQYPIKLDDVIDHLMDEDDLAVLCYSEAGDIISNMLAQGEFLRGIEKEQPDFFLISGGGNDLVNGAGLRRFLLPFADGREPEDYFRPEYEAFKRFIADSFTRVFEKAIKASPEIRILCHGYSYPIPNRGKWLGKPMESIGILDRSVQREIMLLIVDGINESISSAAAAAGHQVTFVDVRSVVPPDGWYDEFHPTSEWFEVVASQFLGPLRS